MSNKIKVTHKNSLLHLDFYPEIFDEKESTQIYRELVKLFCKDFPEKIPPGGVNTLRRRTNLTYGVKGLVYEIHWYGKITRREAKDWSNAKVLLEIKDKISELTNTTYNICCVQIYPNGKHGIKPHRDKEMKQGTVICGVSFGATRILNVARRADNINLELKPGSCYVFNPPTNDYYSHSILTNESKTPRISLTFRTY